MKSIRVALHGYDELTSSERARADEYLRRHPEAWRLVREGRHLRQVLAAASTAEISDDLLATIVASRALGDKALPDSLVPIADAVDAAVSADPTFADRYHRLEARLREIEDEIPPAREHFEKLTASLRYDEKPRRDGSSEPGKRPHARDRRPVIRARRIGMMAVVAVGALFAVLFFVSESTLQPHERLAALDRLPETHAPLALRGAGPEHRSAAASYAAGLDAISDARRTTLGLFPRFSESHLHSALQHMDSVVEAEPPESPIRLRALYAKGRIYLHLGETLRAEQALLEVARTDGSAAIDARELLEAMAHYGITPG
jgi:hypothetical protein